MKTLLMLLVLGSHAADTYYTNRNINVYHDYEYNPLAKPFVHGEKWCISASALGAGAVIGGSYLLRRHHHEKIAETVTLFDIASHTEGAIFSAEDGRK